MFKRTRYQHGSVEREERKKGAGVWVYRWWEEDINGKLLHRKRQIGDVEAYPSESAAHAAAHALRLTINSGCVHKSLQRTTINILWEHYSREELPHNGDEGKEDKGSTIKARFSGGILKPLETVELKEGDEVTITIVSFAFKARSGLVRTNCWWMGRFGCRSPVLVRLHQQPFDCDANRTAVMASHACPLTP